MVESRQFRRLSRVSSLKVPSVIKWRLRGSFSIFLKFSESTNLPYIYILFYLKFKKSPHPSRDESFKLETRVKDNKMTPLAPHRKNRIKPKPNQCHFRTPKRENKKWRVSQKTRKNDETRHIFRRRRTRVRPGKMKKVLQNLAITRKAKTVIVRRRQRHATRVGVRTFP